MYLFDTNVILWILNNDARLSLEILNLISKHPERCAISAASFWEIVIKSRAGKLSLGKKILDALSQSGLRVLDIDSRYTLGLFELPKSETGDPFDEIIMTQAICDDLTLITSDKKILRANIPGLQVMSSRRSPA